MAKTVQARLDERAEEDLALLRNEGHTDSEAIRLALRESAQRRRRRSALRAEAERTGADPDDRTIMCEVLEDMEAVAAPWPND
jgi:Arc/MetJ-type ribon-helix-helix transcriptional regulator